MWRVWESLCCYISTRLTNFKRPYFISCVHFWARITPLQTKSDDIIERLNETLLSKTISEHRMAWDRAAYPRFYVHTHDLNIKQFGRHQQVNSFKGRIHSCHLTFSHWRQLKLAEGSKLTWELLKLSDWSIDWNISEFVYCLLFYQFFWFYYCDQCILHNANDVYVQWHLFVYSFFYFIEFIDMQRYRKKTNVLLSRECRKD